MPFDPLSAGVAGAGIIADYIKSMQAQRAAKDSEAFQIRQLEQALSDARQGKSAALRTAGGMRLDRFGNATYYDPTQGRWITSYSPTQQRLIDEGQARQERTNLRGAQASQDYDTLRGEYLYRPPKSEAESYAEIARLLSQAQGTGERALNTLYNRMSMRTAGNIPTLTLPSNQPDPGQLLAETMLKARGAALDESIKRRQAFDARLLPAMRQFESTANYVQPLDPTGSEIQGMQQSGIQDILKTGSDYDKLLATVAMGGARNVGAAATSGVSAASKGPGASDFLNLAKMLMPQQTKGNPVSLNATGKDRVSTEGGDTDSIGNFDHRFNYLMTRDPQKGAGGEPPGTRYGASSPYDYEFERQNDPWANISPLNIGILSGAGGGTPEYDFSKKFGASGGNYLDPSYLNPWTFG